MFLSLEDLYILIFKDLRTVRNVIRSYKEHTGNSEVNRDDMTGYEKGRLIRSCTRLGSNLETLDLDHGQQKVVGYIYAYITGLGIYPGGYTRPGHNVWSNIYNQTEQCLHKGDILPERYPAIFEYIVGMIDSPLSKVPSRMALMRLSIL